MVDEDVFLVGVNVALLYPNVHSESECDAHLVDAFQGAVKVGGQEVGGEVDAGEEPFGEGEAETRGEFPRVEATEGSGRGTGGDGCEGVARCEGELYAGLIAPLGVEVEGERKGEVESKGGVVPFNCFIQFIGRGGVNGQIIWSGIPCNGLYLYGRVCSIRCCFSKGSQANV